MLGFVLTPEAIAMLHCRKLISTVLLGLTLLALPAPVQAQTYDYRHTRHHRHHRPPHRVYRHHRYDRRS